MIQRLLEWEDLQAPIESTVICHQRIHTHANLYFLPRDARAGENPETKGLLNTVWMVFANQPPPGMASPQDYTICLYM
jgi:hypothetical protein